VTGLDVVGGVGTVHIIIVIMFTLMMQDERRRRRRPRGHVLGGMSKSWESNQNSSVRRAQGGRQRHCRLSDCL
jgi:hypothetical protein